VLLAADYVIMGENSRVGSLYAKVGLTPDIGVSALLADAVGERRALRLLLNDSLLGATEALEWGLTSEVVPADEVGARAQTIAESWLAGATRAYGQAKRLIRSRSTRTLHEQLAEEARTIGVALDGEEARQRVASFGGKAS
jgi:2-(1,2-epoxy-1,2-dihydrophenyl)acetyl-CoA isomerase